MSRNNSRTGIPGEKTTEHSDPPLGIAPIQPNSSDTGSLSVTVPTEFVELPSQGKFYPEDHPLHNESVVEIRHMTAKDEDILSSKALLKQGVAVDRFLRNVIQDKSIDINSLILGDKSAILIAARVSGFGPEYDTKLVCPVCFAHGRHTFNLDDVKVNHGNDIDGLEVERNGAGNLVITTPQTNVRVECQMMTGFHEKQLLAQKRRAEKQKLPDKVATSQMIMSTVSINGNTDKATIRRFAQDMPIKDSRYIRKAIEVCSPNIEIRDFVECLECGASTDMEVPFTTDFFWPK